MHCTQAKVGLALSATATSKPWVNSGWSLHSKSFQSIIHRYWLDEQSQSTYNANGHIFSDPNVGGTEFRTSLAEWSFDAGAGDGYYWVIGR
ncbi:hypothetical protein [Ferrimicrobium acidiphilum]|uniref:hypothetical protein n=1 Tax=Ferrimicrobium acidiphilum TaxID=121039 RepID=UPI0023EF5EC8|nr:hypothetical protein [Ferrimicrobium acidiphilum]